MSSPILPAPGPSGRPNPMSTQTNSGSADLGAFIAELAGDPAAPIAARRSGPPPEVLAQMAAAGEVAELLRSRGRRVRFTSDPERGITIELRDEDGALLRVLSPNEAVELAAGRGLE
jgi:hypothetical protein